MQTQSQNKTYGQPKDQIQITLKLSFAPTSASSQCSCQNQIGAFIAVRLLRVIMTGHINQILSLYDNNYLYIVEFNKEI